MLTAVVISVAACSQPDLPEQQVRKVIEQIELAAEARDTGDLMEHISAEYRDGYGHSAEDLSRYLRGYFVANQSIHLLSRIQELEFTTDDEARAIVQVGMVAREEEAGSDWNLAADVYEFDVVLRHDGEAWRVSHAEWSHRQ